MGLSKQAVVAAGEQPAADPVERIVLVTARAEGGPPDPTADLVSALPATCTTR